MTDIERIATTASNGISATIHRLATLVVGVIVIAALVGLATLATGAWVFDNSAAWWVIGGIICLVPVGASVMAWYIVHRTADVAPRLVRDMSSFLKSSSSASGALIDYDSGTALGVQAKSFRQLRSELTLRRRELPALYAGVRAITSVPGLAAIAFVGILGVGALGTLLLFAGLID